LQPPGPPSHQATLILVSARNRQVPWHWAKLPPASVVLNGKVQKVRTGITGNTGKKTRFQESTQIPLQQRFNDQEARDSLVLTQKIGLFWAVLAAKRGSGGKYLTLCNVFFRFF
jgi:hypothetical protein